MYSVVFSELAFEKTCSTVPSKKFFSLSVWKTSGIKFSALKSSVVLTVLLEVLISAFATLELEVSSYDIT